MKRAYVRVSTIEQNEERQTEGLAKYGIDTWYIDKCSGKNTDRPNLQKMLSDLESGDTVYIWDFSRISRSTRDLLDIVETFQKQGVHLVSAKENLDTTTPQGKLMLTMIGAINEFERVNMLERQREGIAIAKREGKYKQISAYSEDAFENLYPKYLAKQITKVDMAKQMHVSRPTLDKMIKQRTIRNAQTPTEKVKSAKNIREKAGN